MRARFILSTIGPGLGLLSAVLLGLARTGTPPEITFVDFPMEIPADGSEHTGYIGFKDPDGDVIRADFEVVRAVDFQSFSIDLQQFKGLKEGVFSFTISTMTPQEVTLRLTLIDETGNRSEPEELSFVALGTLADLVVSLKQAPSQVFIGDALEVQAVITNQGAVDTGPFRIGLYLSPDAEVSSEDLRLASSEVLNLAPGTSTAEALRATIPEDLFQRPGFRPGEMYLGIIADDTDRVRESNEANNIASTKLRVEERPPVPPPVADFTASPTSGPAPLTVRFTDLSTGEITSYHWDFGDGAASTERDPQHTYQEPGSYTVSLTVGGPGGEGTATKPDFIQVLPARAVFTIVNVTVEPSIPTVGEPATIRSTIKNTGNVKGTDRVSLYIDGAFKAGQTLTLEPSARRVISFNYTFFEEKEYLVEIRTSDDSSSITVPVKRPPRPIARFRAEPRSGSAPLTVRFTNLSENFTSSFWEFGDGATSTETNPVHTYLRAREYTVTLTVCGPGGEDSTSQVITVTWPAGILYQDDFSDPGSGWPIEDWRGYEDGEYFIIIEEADSWGGSIIPGELFFDAFCVEVEARAVGRAKGAYGILFGFKDWDNNYSFAVSTDGWFLVDRMVGGRWIQRGGGWRKSSAIKEGTATNRLKIVIDEARNMKFYINDRLVKTILMETPYKGGEIGIYAWAFEDGFKANFDYVKVMEPDICVQTGALLYQDDFGDPGSGWCTGKDAYHEYAYEDGECSITVNKPNWLYWCWCPKGQVFQDFIVEVEARKISGPEGEYGILWGKDSDNFYLFGISTDGYYTLSKQVNDRWQTPPIPWTRSPAIRTGNQINHLKLVVKGDQVSLYANDVLLKTVTTLDFDRVKIGLVAGTFDKSGVKVHFDDIKIYKVG